MVSIVVLTGAFLSGAIASAIVLLRMGIAREESDESLLDQPSTRAATMTRRAVGLYVRAPRRAAQPDEAPERTCARRGDGPPAVRPRQ